MYGQLAHLNASPRKQLPQLLVAFGAALAARDNLSLSESATSFAPPASLPSSNTTLASPFRSSASSSSASPHVQPLHALLRRGPPALDGSHAAGRALSASVSKLSASIVSPRGAVRSQMAFLAATLRRGRAAEAGATVLVFKDTDAPAERGGFWAIIVPSASWTVRTLNPAKIRLEERLGGSEEVRWSKCSVPSGESPSWSWESKSDKRGCRVW